MDKSTRGFDSAQPPIIVLTIKYCGSQPPIIVLRFYIEQYSATRHCAKDGVGILTEHKKSEQKKGG